MARLLSAPMPAGGSPWRWLVLALATAVVLAAGCTSAADGDPPPPDDTTAVTGATPGRSDPRSTGSPAATAAPTPRASPPAGAPATATTGPLADLAVATADGIYAARLDGSSGRTVATGVCAPGRGGASNLALAPNGRTLAFVCGYATGGDPPWQPGLFLLDLASARAQRIEDQAVDAAGSLAWSPDGRFLAYLRLVDLGPAPVGAGELRVYDAATQQTRRLAEPRHFAIAPVWTPDGSAVVYLVGSWQHSGGPVTTYRAPLDGSGAAPWRSDVHALIPGADGRWLGLREPRDREGLGRALLIAPEGAVREIALPPAAAPPPEAVTRPLGWLGADPVVWRQTRPADADGPGRGEVWLAGPAPRLLLADLPRPDVSSGRGPVAVLAGRQLLYVDGGRLWLADLATGRKTSLADGVQPPVAVRVDALAAR